MNIQDKYLPMYNGSCLALCYAYIIESQTKSGVELEKAITSDVLSGIAKGYIDENDCTVNNGESYMNMIDGHKHKYFIEKKSINTIANIKSMTPVCYQNGAYKHWVVVENGTIIFNSLENSKCVKFGKPCDCRIIRSN